MKNDIWKICSIIWNKREEKWNFTKGPNNCNPSKLVSVNKCLFQAYQNYLASSILVMRKEKII